MLKIIYTKLLNKLRIRKRILIEIKKFQKRAKTSRTKRDEKDAGVIKREEVNIVDWILREGGNEKEGHVQEVGHHE